MLLHKDKAVDDVGSATVHNLDKFLVRFDVVDEFGQIFRIWHRFRPITENNWKVQIMERNHVVISIVLYLVLDGLRRVLKENVFDRLIYWLYTGSHLLINAIEMISQNGPHVNDKKRSKK